MKDVMKYAIRMHDRNTEDDPELATVIYTTDYSEGRWYDVVTGHPEWCEEVLDALQYRANARRNLNENDLTY